MSDETPTSPSEPTEPSGPLATVCLLGLPVAVHRRATDHQDTLRRELALVEAGEPAAAGARLVELSEAYRARYGEFTRPQNTAIAEAAEDGTLDLAYEVPAEFADAAEQLGLLLNEIDELCAAGELVTLVTPPEALAYRRWFLGEFIHQIREGRDPVPWPGFEEAVRGPAGSPAAPGADPLADIEPLFVDGDLDLFGAPALRTAIVERLEGGDRWVVVDLSRCGFIDSVGLSLLLTTRERCKAAGGGLVVVGAADAALRLFDTVGVRQLLTR